MDRTRLWSGMANLKKNIKAKGRQYRDYFNNHQKR